MRSEVSKSFTRRCLLVQLPKPNPSFVLCSAEGCESPAFEAYSFNKSKASSHWSLCGSQLQPFRDSRSLMRSEESESRLLRCLLTHLPRGKPPFVPCSIGGLATPVFAVYSFKHSYASDHRSLWGSQLQPFRDSSSLMRSEESESLFCLWVCTQLPKANPVAVLNPLGGLASSVPAQ